MAGLRTPAYKDPHFGLERTNSQPPLYIRAAGPGTPSGLALPAAGYAPGCTFQNTTNPAVIGTVLYVNTGSTTAAVWTNIL